MFASPLYPIQKSARFFMVSLSLLALPVSTMAGTTEESAIAVAKTAHAQIIGSASISLPPSTTVAPRRPGMATPDEVAIRIAARLAELRTRQMPKKAEVKRERPVERASI